MHERDTTTRRAFLMRTGGALAAAPFARLAGAAPVASGQTAPAAGQKRLGWALVGLGSLSVNQIMPAFQHCKLSRLSGLVSGTAEKRAKFGRELGIPERSIYTYETYDEIAGNPDIDVIYIVLPNGMHAEYTIRALEAGKHVLCEKPMANTPAECQAMIDAARKANRKLMVAYRLRYEPYNQAIIRAARDKQIGDLKMIVADVGFNIGDPKQWRLNRKMAGGGSLMDIGIYALNAARYIAGEEPQTITALMHSTPGDPRFREVEETVTFQMRFPSGVMASCTSTYGYNGMNRFRALGTKGWAELEPALSYSGLRMRMAKDETPVPVEFPPVNHFAAEMDHLSECILEDRTPLTPGEEGLRDLEAITAIYESARTGRTIAL